MKTPTLRLVDRFARVQISEYCIFIALLFIALALGSTFAGEATGQTPGAAGLETRVKTTGDSPSDHAPDAPPPKMHDNEPASSRAYEIDRPSSARASEHRLGHLNEKLAPNGQTRVGSELNLRLPTLNKPRAPAKESASSHGIGSSQRNLQVHSPLAKLSAPVNDAVHSRMPAPASIGGPNSSARSNPALHGLNGTRIKHKP
jgi:hypothetical protein